MLATTLEVDCNLYYALLQIDDSSASVAHV